MKTPYDTWADAFQFSEDLKTLEELYQQQHQEALKEPYELTSPENGVSQSEDTTSSEDARFLNQLSERIASRLHTYLSKPDVLAQYFRFTDLQHDNQVMAQQIETQLKRIQALEAELQIAHYKESQFRPLLGRFYVRVD